MLLIWGGYQGSSNITDTKLMFIEELKFMCQKFGEESVDILEESYSAVILKL